MRCLSREGYVDLEASTSPEVSGRCGRCDLGWPSPGASAPHRSPCLKVIQVYFQCDHGDTSPNDPGGNGIRLLFYWTGSDLSVTKTGQALTRTGPRGVRDRACADRLGRIALQPRALFCFQNPKIQREDHVHCAIELVIECPRGGRRLCN